MVTLSGAGQTAEGESLDVARLLIEHGAEVDARDEFGTTPLHAAVVRGSLDVVRLLIELGADIEAKSADGVTPLHVAAFYNLLGVARILIEKGANTEGIDLSWMK